MFFTQSPKLISIVVPFLNEEENLPLMHAALREVSAALPQYEFEFLYVNDGSTDRSGRVCDELALQDTRVRHLEFSRNFGKESATTAGIHQARGSAVLMLDADLQHPPSLIPELVRHWEEGAEVVVGVRTANHDEGFVKRYGSLLFYEIMERISETAVMHGETDFRLLDRAVVDAFNTLPERRRMTRSLINWLGFRKVVVEFEAPAREHGEAKYTPGKLIHLAFNSFISNSLLPLRLAGYLGVTIVLISGMLGTAVFFERYIFNDALGWAVSGTAQLAIVNVFLIGIVLAALGIIALYIENIHVEVAQRPLYVLRAPKAKV